MSCQYCEPKTSRFDQIWLSDIDEGCKWCTKEVCDNVDDSCYGRAYVEVPLHFCPNCGAKLKD